MSNIGLPRTKPDFLQSVPSASRYYMSSMGAIVLDTKGLTRPPGLRPLEGNATNSEGEQKTFLPALLPIKGYEKHSHWLLTETAQEDVQKAFEFVNTSNQYTTNFFYPDDMNSLSLQICSLIFQ